MIYRQLLRDDFDRLPGVFRALHSTPGFRRAAGTASVLHQSPLLARLLKFPEAGPDISMQLEIIAQHHQEIWIRKFGHATRRSVQRARDGLLIEDAGPVQLEFRICSSSRGIRYQSVRAHLLGIPVPVHIEALEEGDDCSWTFDVTISPIGSYRGSMELLR